MATSGDIRSRWRERITRGDRPLYQAKASTAHVAVYNRREVASSSSR